MDKDDEFLRRYTDIPALLYLLRNRKLTMLDPGLWDDQNDTHYLSTYKTKKSLKSLFVLCFTEVTETYHHWRVFAGGSSGVCIKFLRDELLTELKKTKGIRCDQVKYLTLADLRENEPMVDELPFIKRYGFQDESEYRVIYESKSRKMKKKNIAIPLSCIDKITLSPWIRKSLASSLKETIKLILDSTEISVVKSTLVSNEEWKSIGKGAS